MDMHKILSNIASVEKGEYKPSESTRNEIKTILESFNEIATSDKQQLDEIASVTMSGETADEVAQLVKLMNAAGAPEAAPVGPQPTTMHEPSPCGDYDGPPDMPPKADMITPKMLDDIEADSAVIQDDWDNEPDERYDDHHKMTKDLSGGLNRPKKSYKAAEPGDNAMAVESSLREELSKMLKQKMREKKGAKPDFLDLDGDGDTEEPMKKAAKDKKKGAVGKKKTDTEVEEAGKLKGGAKDPCWKGYKMVGTKKKGGKEVPNCVPRESIEEKAEIKRSSTDNKNVSKRDVTYDVYVNGKFDKHFKDIIDAEEYAKKKDPSFKLQKESRSSSKKVEQENARTLAEGIVDQIRNVVDNKSAQRVQFDNGETLTVDLFTASALANLYNAVNDANKAKIEDNLGKSKEMFTKMADFAMKQVGSKESVEEDASDTKAKMKQIVSAFRPISKSEKIVKAFSYKPYRDSESIPVIITKDPKVDEETDYPFAVYIKSSGSSEMGHYEYYDNIETAISDAKFYIKDEVDRPSDGPAPGQQRLPFEAKNNPVAKHAGTFNKAQVQTDRKKELKKGKSVKHKGKEFQTESAPVFERYVKPFLDKTPAKIVEFYDSEARTIIKRLGEERIQLQRENADVRAHDTVLAQLRENLGVLSEAPYGRRRSSFDIGRTGYGPGGDLGAADKRDFKRREMEIELGDEAPNNYAVSIDGKPWKVFRSQRSAQKAAATIKSKYGKDTKVYQTAAPTTS